MATLPKPTPPTDAEIAIRALAHEFVKLHNARDIEKLIKLFTRDGCIMTPHQPIAESTNVLRQHFFDTFAEFDARDLRLEIMRIEVSDKFALSFGTFTRNVQIPGGKRVDDRGKWMATLRREAGAWLICGYCSNTDLPVRALVGT